MAGSRCECWALFASSRVVVSTKCLLVSVSLCRNQIKDSEEIFTNPEGQLGGLSDLIGLQLFLVGCVSFFNGLKVFLKQTEKFECTLAKLS